MTELCKYLQAIDLNLLFPLFYIEKGEQIMRKAAKVLYIINNIKY